MARSTPKQPTMMSFLSQVESHEKQVTDPNVSEEFEWFEDNLLDGFVFPKTVDTIPTAEDALFVLHYILDNQDSAAVHALAPRMLTALASQCLLSRNGDTRILVAKSAEQKWKYSDSDDYLNVTDIAAKIRWQMDRVRRSKQTDAKTPVQSQDRSSSTGSQEYDDAQSDNIIEKTNDKNEGPRISRQERHEGSILPEGFLRALNVVIPKQTATIWDNFEEILTIYTPDIILRYCGAYAFSTFRLVAKPEKKVQDFFVKKFQNIFVGVYGKTCPKPTALGDTILKEIKLAYSGSESTFIHAILCATAAAKRKQAESMINVPILRGFAMITVAEHALPLWSWTRRAAGKIKVSPLVLLAYCAHGATNDSIANVYRFVYTYMATEDEFKDLPKEVKILLKLTTQKKSIYWNVARLLSTNYLTIVGRKDNEDLIALLISIFNLHAKEDELVKQGTYIIPQGQITADIIEIMAKKIKKFHDAEVDAGGMSKALTTDLTEAEANQQRQPDDDEDIYMA